MTETLLAVTCDGSSVDELFAMLRGFDSDVQRSTKQGIDGEAATSWVLVAGFAVQQAPAFLSSLREFLTRNRVQEIRVGDVTIVNPGPDDVESALRRQTVADE